MLRDGASAGEVVAQLAAADDGREERQLGVVDALGQGASFTGSACMNWAGGRTGHCFAAQGNLLVSERDGGRLAAAFEAIELSACGAPPRGACRGQLAGGDRRGQQPPRSSSSSARRGYAGLTDTVIDLRVDDHERPVDELARLLALHELYFGETPADEWIPVTGELAAELSESLARLGYATGDLAADLDEWAGYVNLEERVSGAARIDPVVLGELRRAAAS